MADYRTCECGAAAEYVKTYDRYACRVCNRWTDKPCQCGMSECPFPQSPERPFEKEGT